MTIASSLSARQWAFLVLSGLLLVATVLFFGARMSRADSSSVMITSSDVNPTVAKVGDTVTLSFTTSASSTNPTVSIEGHEVGASGGPTDWTASYIIQASDPAGLVPFLISVNGGSITNTTNNSSVVVYSGGPTVQLSTTAATEPGRTNQTTVPVMVTFSEPVLHFTAGDLKTPEGTVTNFTSEPGGQIYTFDLTLNSQYDTFFAYVKADEVTDVAGNYNSYSNELSFIYSPTPWTGEASNPSEVTVAQNPTTVTVTGVTAITNPLPTGSMTSSTSAGMMSANASMPAGMDMNTTPAMQSSTGAGMIGTSSDLMGTSSDMMGSSSGSTTLGTSSSGLRSPAVWAGIVIILVLLIGGGWWYSRNATPPPTA